MKQLILASTSAIRRDILAQAGFDFTTIGANVNEQAIKQSFQGSNFEQLALELADAKAQAVSQQYPDAIVIGCDQLCLLDNQILSKPGSIEQAIAQLQRLNGKTHQLISAVVMWQNQKRQWQQVEAATMTMKQLSNQAISAYVHQDEPLHSCGAYYYELNGHTLFNKVEGEKETILGLPIKQLSRELKNR